MGARSSKGRRGRGGVPLLGLMALVGLAALWIASNRSGDRGGLSPRPEMSSPTAGSGPALEAPAGESAAGLRSPSADGQEPGFGASGDAPPSGADRFRGRGSLRGHVEVSGNLPFPGSWRLVLTPSTTLVGREFAEERVFDFSGATQDFDVQDLPLAGYDVHAEAEAWNGQRQPVLLEARSPSAFVNLRMVRAGAVDGRLFDADGTPAEGVVVTLTQLPNRAMRETRTDSLGTYRFEPVLDGSYELGVGPFQNPILKRPQTLAVQSPGVSVPDIELPPLATLELVYFDGDDERLLTDVEVVGSGVEGGAFEARTDSYGTIRVNHLPPGRWRVRASTPGYRTRRDQFQLVADQVESTTLGLARE